MSCRCTQTSSAGSSVSLQDQGPAGVTNSIGAALSSSKLCFGCATFWIIIVVLGLFVLAGSGRRGG